MKIARHWHEHISFVHETFEAPLSQIGVTIHLLQWGYAMYLSRAMLVPCSKCGGNARCAAMVPVGDMLNHQSGSPAYWRLHSRVVHPAKPAGKRRRLLLDDSDNNEEAGGAHTPAPTLQHQVQLMLGRDVARGERVCIPYGAKGADSLLLSFGFLEGVQGEGALDVQLAVSARQAGAAPQMHVQLLTVLPADAAGPLSQPAKSTPPPFLTTTPILQDGSPSPVFTALMQEIIQASSQGVSVAPVHPLRVAHHSPHPEAAGAPLQSLPAGAAQLSCLHGALHVATGFIMCAAAVHVMAAHPGVCNGQLVVAHVMLQHEGMPAAAAAGGGEFEPNNPVGNDDQLPLHVVVHLQASSGGAGAKLGGDTVWRSQQDEGWLPARQAALRSTADALAALHRQESAWGASEALALLQSTSPSGGTGATHRAHLQSVLLQWGAQRRQVLHDSEQLLRRMVAHTSA